MYDTVGSLVRFDALLFHHFKKLECLLDFVRTTQYVGNINNNTQLSPQTLVPTTPCFIPTKDMLIRVLKMTMSHLTLSFFIIW